jgi:hypothetical protein
MLLSVTSTGYRPNSFLFSGLNKVCFLFFFFFERNRRIALFWSGIHPFCRKPKEKKKIIFVDIALLQTTRRHSDERFLDERHSPSWELVEVIIAAMLRSFSKPTLLARGLSIKIYGEVYHYASELFSTITSWRHSESQILIDNFHEIYCSIW